MKGKGKKILTEPRILYDSDGAAYSIAKSRNRKKSHNPLMQIDKDIPLSLRATEIIRAMDRGDNDAFIFPITVNALRSSYQRARKRAGLPHFRIHDRASILAATGFKPHQLMAALGHDDIRSTSRYVNISAAEVLDNFRQFSM